MRFLSCTRSGLSFLLPGIEPFNNIVSKTIVATALPTIVSKLGGGSRYSWVGRFVPSSQRLSIKVIDLLLHALVPTCWPQPGVLSILLFLSINLIILQSFTFVWEIIGSHRSETHTVLFNCHLLSKSFLYWLSKVELISMFGKARICTKRCRSKHGTALFLFILTLDIKYLVTDMADCGKSSAGYRRWRYHPTGLILLVPLPRFV